MRWSPKAKEVLTKFAKSPRQTAQGVSVPSTKTVKAQVAKLTKQVKKLNTISYDKAHLVMGVNNGPNVLQPYYQYALCNGMNTWPTAFGLNAADLADVQKMYVNSYTMDVRLVQAGESDRIFYTAFVVSLKDEAADASTLDPLDGKLVLQDGLHFQNMGTNGRVLVNPKMFNIHYMKRFSMGGRVGDQSTPETKNLHFKIVPKEKLIVNTRGNIFGSAASPNNGLTYPKNPSQNYFFLLFNDDSLADLAANQIYIGGLASVAIPS